MYDYTKPQVPDLQERNPSGNLSIPDLRECRLHGNLSVPDLRECRLCSNLSVIEVQGILDQDYEIRTSGKTIYGWEAGRSLPVPSTFIAICKIYGIRRLRLGSCHNGTNPGICKHSNISTQSDTISDIRLHRGLRSEGNAKGQPKSDASPATPVHLSITGEELRMLHICRLHPALMNKAMQKLM